MTYVDVSRGWNATFLTTIAFYGVYVALFALSIVTSDGKRWSTVRSTVVVTFVVVNLYIAAMSANRMLTVDSDYLANHRLLSITATWCSMCPCICCALSDGVLAWRCYVIFDRRLWVKWALLFAMPCVCVIGIVTSAINLFEQWNVLYPFEPVPLGRNGLFYGSVTPTTLTWAGCSLALNTVLSTCIIAKILLVRKYTRQHIKSSRFVPLARAFIESSLLSWIFLAVFIGMYADLTTDNELENATVTLLPLIFSISQTLVISRIGISRLAASGSVHKTVIALTDDFADASQMPADELDGGRSEVV